MLKYKLFVVNIIKYLNQKEKNKMKRDKVINFVSFFCDNLFQ